MNAHARPQSIFAGDASLAGLLTALSDHDEKALVMTYAGRTIRPGYHVTEVKAGSFVTLGCGGNPDRWEETIVQVEDIGAEGENSGFMRVGKFRSILDQAAGKLQIDGRSRLTFEISQPDEPMAIFDVWAVTGHPDRVALELTGRPAICKPRHREPVASSQACCDSAKARCCA
jgi:hypothetical protein